MARPDYCTLVVRIQRGLVWCQSPVTVQAIQGVAFAVKGINKLFIPSLVLDVTYGQHVSAAAAVPYLAEARLVPLCCSQLSRSIFRVYAQSKGHCQESAHENSRVRV